MPPFRDMTAAEAEERGNRHHEKRAADEFHCPHCHFRTGLSSFIPDACVAQCDACKREFFAWTVPGTIHVSAKL